MAKYYGIGGKRVGSVGNETYTIVKGNNIVKSKVINVNDARTPEQIEQRSKMQNAVKIYQQIGAAFLKKCFEFKKPKQSTYNAFVSANVKHAEPFYKKFSKDKNILGIGNFVVSEGSLPVIPVVKSPELTIEEKKYTYMGIAVDKALTAASTVGDVSASLKQLYNLKEGDFINGVAIHNFNVASNDDEQNPLILTEPYYVEKSTKNFIIKAQDNDAITTKGFTIVGNENNKYLVILDDNQLAPKVAKGCVYTSDQADSTVLGFAAYFVSKKENGKILVSTGRASNSKQMEDLIQLINQNPELYGGWLSTAMKIFIITSYGIKKIIEIIRDWPI